MTSFIDHKGDSVDKKKGEISGNNWWSSNGLAKGKSVIE